MNGGKASALALVTATPLAVFLTWVTSDYGNHEAVNLVVSFLLGFGGYFVCRGWFDRRDEKRREAEQRAEFAQRIEAILRRLR